PLSLMGPTWTPVVLSAPVVISKPTPIVESTPVVVSSATPVVEPDHRVTVAIPEQTVLKPVRDAGWIGSILAPIGEELSVGCADPPIAASVTDDVVVAAYDEAPELEEAPPEVEEEPTGAAPEAPAPATAASANTDTTDDEQQAPLEASVEVEPDSS